MSAALREASEELIVLVDERGTPIGSAEKWSSHHADTPLHLAFSCYVFDEHGRLLVTRRAAGKKVWPGVWSNTVCGHPQPGESMGRAVRRRLAYELGMGAAGIEVALPDYRYRAPAFAGIVENEFCPVYLARGAGDPDPNPAEVEAWQWVTWDEFVAAAGGAGAGAWSWWCKDQLAQLREHPLLGTYAGR